MDVTVLVLMRMIVRVIKMRVPMLTVVPMGRVATGVRVFIRRRHQTAGEHHRGQALPNS
jgi:hypothetical protein